MATTLTILSDTHLPKRAKSLPAALWDDIEHADVVLHAGDWVSLDLVDEIERRARQLIGVRGNNDVDAGFADRLPLEARAEIEGLRFAVVHETGQTIGRERRMRAAYPDTDVIVFGHSHIPWDTTIADEHGTLRLLNPGSPTDRRRQPDFTWMRATVDRRAIDVELVRLEP
jgi:uncharacterized protein